jgi:hypothetical protein
MAFAFPGNRPRLFDGRLGVLQKQRAQTLLAVPDGLPVDSITSLKTWAPAALVFTKRKSDISSRTFRTRPPARTSRWT